MSDDSDVVDVHVVCGPTASGKSAIAMWIASQRPTTIVSADSRQIYQQFDIGTAKPSHAERGAVPHRGIDIVAPDRRYSAAAWAESADGYIAEAISTRRLPLVVGGTGLYLRALFDGLFEEPALDPDRRDALDRCLAAIETSELRRWVAALDAPRAPLGRTQLIRAIEIAFLTGRRLSDLHRNRARTSRWRATYLVLDPGAVLADRIAARLDDMLDHGWPDEVQRLMRTISEDAPAWKATGYDAVRRLVRGTLSRAGAREEILIATRQYAKRQRTWFRHQLPAERVTRVDPADAGWTAAVSRWIDGTGRAREALA